MSSVAKLVKRRERIKREKIPHNWPLPDTLMGIELEVEQAGSSYSTQPPAEWGTHRDGSLNNGVEFVLARPMAGDELRSAIASIFAGNRFARSMTGSTHIHMDMLEENSTTEVLQVMVLLVYCLESVLFAAGDPAREWCGFANRLQSGPDTLMTVVLSDSLHDANDRMVDEFSRNYSRNSSTFGRYYGLNMASLLDYGSLEFRYFPTAISEQEMVRWVELVQTFKRAALTLGNVEALSQVMGSEDSYNSFLHENFGEFSSLFSYLGSYWEVRQSFHKALLTAKVSSPLRKEYDGRKIFANGNFSKFVKNMSDVTSIHIVGVNTDDVPNSSQVQDGDLLVYNHNVYVMYAARASSTPSWQMITDLPHTGVRRMDDLARNLEALRSEEIWESIDLYYRETIDQILADRARSAGEQEAMAAGRPEYYTISEAVFYNDDESSEEGEDE